MRIPASFISLSGIGIAAAMLAANPACAEGAAPGATLPPAMPAASVIPSAPVAAVPLLPGVWQKHEYSFAFMGFTSTYSCDGLASKLKILLLASGARADAKASSGACASGFGHPDRFARADLIFYTLAPPNAAQPAEGPLVNAAWLPVSLAAHRPRDLATGDCELMEQFQANVLPLFTTRNVENRTSCVPHQESGSVVNLTFDALGPAPKVPAPKAPAPGA